MAASSLAAQAAGADPEARTAEDSNSRYTAVFVVADSEEFYTPGNQLRVIDLSAGLHYGGFPAGMEMIVVPGYDDRGKGHHCRHVIIRGSEALDVRTGEWVDYFDSYHLKWIPAARATGWRKS